MRKLFILFLLITSQLVLAQEPANLSILKRDLIRYQDSGEYAYDIGEVVERAHDYLVYRIKENKRLMTPKKLAIVLDIDETSISNYALLNEYDFSNSETKGAWSQMSKADAKVIEPTLRLTQLAKENGVSVFFVTGRKENFREATLENLRKAGYRQWTEVYFQPRDYHENSISIYKTAIRKSIAKQGYDIVLNMGDQYSDLKGGYAERIYKLANPYYFVP